MQATVDGLIRRQLVMERSGFGSRVPKYQHLFCNTEYGSLKFSPQQTGIVCELLVRGPQTPGELRTRAARMAPLHDVTEADGARGPDDPAGRPVRRETRPRAGPARVALHASVQRRCAAASAGGAGWACFIGAVDTGHAERLTALEQAVDELRCEVAELKAKVETAGS